MEDTYRYITLWRPTYSLHCYGSGSARAKDIEMYNNTIATYMKYGYKLGGIINDTRSDSTDRYLRENSTVTRVGQVLYIDQETINKQRRIDAEGAYLLHKLKTAEENYRDGN